MWLGWLSLVLATSVHAERVIDWPAQDDGRAGPAWTVQTFGNVRAAGVRPVRAGGARAAEATIESADESPPPAQLRLPVPLKGGHVYRSTVRLSSPAPIDVDVMLRRGPAPYDPMGMRTVRVGPEPVTVAFDAAWPIGAIAGDLRIVWKQSKARVTVLSTTVDDLGPVPLSAPLPITYPPTLIGLHVNKLGQHQTWPEAGQRLVRLWDTGTTWSRLAPTEADRGGSDSAGWRQLRKFVDYVRENDPQQTLLFTLGMPPSWASDRPDDSKCPYGVGSCGAPASMEAWREYVRQLALRYKGVIRYWELWNEPDYRFFYASSRSMVELAKAAREELKAVDPENRLLSPGVTASGGTLWLHNFLEAGGGAYVDAIGFHWYFGAVPEELRVSMFNVRQILAAHGQAGKPIWNTEGAPVCRRAAPGGPCVMDALSPEQAESVAPRAILTMWVNGVSAFAYYTAEGAGERTIALLTPDWKASSRAAHTLRSLGDWLQGAQAVAMESTADGVYVLGLRKAGREAHIVWTEGQQARFDVPRSWSIDEMQPLGAPAAPMPTDGRIQAGPVPVLLSGR